ncbi:hypothetical protein ABZ863_13890 [Saccharomonospora sp. NPDC046836]|uniref:hypothetical protein n=1 Tax=Saccharomonospora sp. NPDC046836 TaxID=3156921 RepID=UPI0033FCAD51
MIEIVVNNAGIVQFHKFAEYPDDEFEQMLSLRGTGGSKGSPGRTSPRRATAASSTRSRPLPGRRSTPGCPTSARNAARSSNAISGRSRRRRYWSLAHSSCTLTGEIIAAAGAQVSRFILGQTEGATCSAELTPEDSRTAYRTCGTRRAMSGSVW